MAHQHGPNCNHGPPVPALNPKTIPKPVKDIADWLLSSAAKLKQRKGQLNGKRVEYFKGKHAVNALLREPYKQGGKRAPIEGRAEGEAHLAKLAQHGLILKVAKESGSKILKSAQDNYFSPDNYYIWIYQASQIQGMVMGVGVLLLVFAGVLFPLWPPFMRQGAYYVSLLMTGLLGLLMALGVIRAILWVILLVVLGRGGWLFPNLFADVGVIESFQPLWSWDKKKKAKKA